MKTITVIDRVSYSITSNRQYTDEGFLMVPARAARTGIQQYLAHELGLKDREPNAIVNVYRPPEEVFNSDSLASYEAKDVTNDHPDEMVTAATYKELTVGHVRGVGSQDGDFVLVDLILKDEQAIKDVEKGKVQLSAGYSAVYDNTPGATPSGEHYEFIQRDIRVNHVALVDRARAGAMARIFDNQKNGGHKMPTITLDTGRAIEVQDDATAALVQDAMQRLNDKAKDAQKAADKAQATADGLQAKLDAKDAEISELKESVSDKAISGRITAIQSAMDSARKVAGKDFTCDSLDVTEIKRAALVKLGKNVADKSAAYVEAAFDMAEEKAEEAEDEEEEDKKKSEDSLKKFAGDFDKLKPSEAQAVRDKTHEEYLKKRYNQ